jgi:integrase/recombinase XerD
MIRVERSSAKKKAKELAKYLRSEQPDYFYLKSVFRHLRTELNIPTPTATRKLPSVPSEEEIRQYYKAVWQTRNMKDMIIIKTLLYTGARVSELINIQLDDIDFELCQIRINSGKGDKDRIVPFPANFKETLALHVDGLRHRRATFLFESSRKQKYSDRGIRKILAKYTQVAGLKHPLSPHKLRHFLFTWLKKQGIDDALIQPYSGHASRQSLEVYSHLTIKEAQQKYNQVIERFPV